MKMNPRIIKRVYRGYVIRRDNQLNDANLTGHITASKFAQAFNGDKKFNDPIKIINSENIGKHCQDVVDLARQNNFSRKLLRDQILKGV